MHDELVLLSSRSFSLITRGCASDRQTDRARAKERARAREGGGRGEGDFGNRIAFQGNPFEYMALDL